MPTRKQTLRILIAAALALFGLVGLFAIPAVLVGAPALHHARPHTADGVDLGGK